MSAWWQLTKESFLMLRRDRIFFPIIIAGLSIAVFANIASNWSMEDFDKILFDVGIAGFRITGGIVSILWGVRLITDPLQDRSIELRIAAPQSRATWLLARYSGLVACLLLTGLGFAAVWQALMALNNFGIMTNMQSWTFGMLFLEWLVLGAIGLLMGTLAGFSTALFVSIGAWLIGLIAPLVAATMDQTVDPIHRKLIEFIANSWNFQRFNLVDQLEAGARSVSMSDLVPRLTWGGSVLVGCLVLASWVFRDKDLT